MHKNYEKYSYLVGIFNTICVQMKQTLKYYTKCKDKNTR